MASRGPSPRSVQAGWCVGRADSLVGALGCRQTPSGGCWGPRLPPHVGFQSLSTRWLRPCTENVHSRTNSPAHQRRPAWQRAPSLPSCWRPWPPPPPSWCRQPGPPACQPRVCRGHGRPGCRQRHGSSCRRGEVLAGVRFRPGFPHIREVKAVAGLRNAHPGAAAQL